MQPIANSNHTEKFGCFGIGYRRQHTAKYVGVNRNPDPSSDFVCLSPLNTVTYDNQFSAVTIDDFHGQGW